MTETADVIVVGAGVQGASLAFHLAKRGARVLVVERDTVAAGATGRSSGFVRMHYDLESDVRLAFASFPYFRSWQERVGAGDCGFVRTGFMHVMPEALADNVRANVLMQQRVGVETRTVTAAEVGGLLPGAVTGRHRRRRVRARVGVCGSVGDGGRVPRGRARPRGALHPGLSRGFGGGRGRRGRRCGHRPRTVRRARRWSMSRARGRPGSPPRSAWTSRSRRGGTPPPTSACRTTMAPTSRS